MNNLDQLHVQGPLTCQSFTPPAGCITDAAVQAAANVAASKLEHQHQQLLASSGLAAVAALREAIHRVRGSTGTLVAFAAWLRQGCVGDSTVTVDLWKNGASVLTAPLVLNSTHAAFVAVNGTFSVASLAAGDVLEVNVTVNAGTGTLGQGLGAQVTLRELAQ